ncbi:uncharacterized protein LOC123877946 isoform X2 [Maniola jurtina]|uniref:uncharacterized protein LOC123877946 isoform X2 n=1 Tax=Maniola jurtina TaxID=191418 RepID=UPI001E686D8F|nr:uncharacterized protein LOC123877946 isoform X2 [Maniola jurtina]
MCVSNTTIACLIILTFDIGNSSAGIQINITVASDKRDLNVTFYGSDDKVVSDREVKLYNITEDRLKNGTGHEFGVTPSDVFLTDPTPYGNLYLKYKWRQVTRRVTVSSAAVREVINEDVVLAVHEHINNTPIKVKVPIKLLQDVEYSLKSTWSKSGLPGDDVNYNTRVNFFNNKQFLFEKKWRNESMETATLPFGVQRPGNMTLAPRRRVTMKLRAKRTVVLLTVTYAAYLTGSVVANYPRLLGSYHFWAPAVDRVMAAARPRLNNRILTTELVELKCYTDPFLDVDVIDKT